MMLIEILMLVFLVLAAVTVCLMRRLLASMIVFASYNVVMSVLWILLCAPDLAITEAAVGAGFSTILFFIVLKQIRVMEVEYREERITHTSSGNQEELR